MSDEFLPAQAAEPVTVKANEALVDEIASLIAEHARRKYVFPEDIELAEKIAARRAPQAPQGDWVVALRADGSRVSLAECPIGLFLAESGELCLKTEYGNNEGRIDAYIVSSGEMFWGHAPQTIASQQAELVQPVALAPKEGAPAADLDRAIDAVAGTFWNDIIGRHGGAWEHTAPNGIAAMQTRATARAALKAAARFLPAQAAEPVTVKALLTRALSLIDAMFTNDPNEPVSDAGHTALDLWRHEADALRSALSGAAPQAGEDARRWSVEVDLPYGVQPRIYDGDGALVAVVGNAEKDRQDEWERNAVLIVNAVNSAAVAAPPVEGWRPIETAPKDGTPVLLHWGKGFHPLSGHYENGKFGQLGFDWGFSPFPSQPKFWLSMDALPIPPDSQGGEDA